MRSVARLVIAASSLVLNFGNSNVLIAAHAQQEVCDLDADYFVGAKDEAIRPHTEMVRVHPLDGLAHCPGFALGNLSAERFALLPIIVRWRKANGNKSRSVENA